MKRTKKIYLYGANPKIDKKIPFILGLRNPNVSIAYINGRKRTLRYIILHSFIRQGSHNHTWAKGPKTEPKAQKLG